MKKCSNCIYGFGWDFEPEGWAICMDCNAEEYKLKPTFKSWIYQIVAHAFNDAMQEMSEYQRHIDLLQKLIDERDRILDALPCPLHGRCVPHVLDFIEENKK